MRSEAKLPIGTFAGATFPISAESAAVIPPPDQCRNSSAFSRSANLVPLWWLGRWPTWPRRSQLGVEDVKVAMGFRQMGADR